MGRETRSDGAVPPSAVSAQITWPFRLLAFLGWYAGQLLVSNATVVRDILTHQDRSKPRVVRYESACRTERELALVALAITLTPGTLVISMNAGAGEPPAAAGGVAARALRARFVLYVHVMYHGDRNEALADISHLEEWLLWGTRLRGLPC